MNAYRCRYVDILLGDGDHGGQAFQIDANAEEVAHATGTGRGQGTLQVGAERLQIKTVEMAVGVDEHQGAGSLK
jgi:hypothetical protein